MTDLSESPQETIAPIALVTGAAHRIGREIALGLAESGFDIALHYHRSEAEARETAEMIQAMGRRTTLLDADLAEPNIAASLPDRARDVLGGLGVVVNNAARFEKDSHEDCTAEGWAAHMAINLESPFRIIQSFARTLPPTQNGVVVNILDQRVFNLTPHFLSYTLSKSGLWTLTRTLALALAPRIRVAAIGPGPTAPSPRQQVKDFQAQSAIIPLQRRTAPRAIAHAVRFILESPSFTGQMIALDGGEHLGWRQDADGAYVEE